MKLLTAFVFLITTTFTFFNNSESIQTNQAIDNVDVECTFTYEQGYAIGCALAQQAQSEGCDSYDDCY